MAEIVNTDDFDPQSYLFSDNKGGPRKSDLQALMGGVNKGLLSTFVSAGRSVPGTDLLTAFVMDQMEGTEKNFRGEPHNIFESFPRNYAKTKKIGDRVENMSSVGKFAGKVAGGGTTFSAARSGLDDIAQSIPLDKLDKLPAALKTILGLAGEVGKSATANVASGQSQELDPSQIKKQALIGGASEVASQLIRAAATPTDKAGRNIMSTKIKTPPDAAKKGKDFAKDAYDMGLKGSYSNMGKQLDTAEDALEAQVQHELKGIPGKANPAEISKRAHQLAEESIGHGVGAKSIRDKAHEIIADEMPKKPLTYQDLNQLKRDTGKFLGKNFFKGDMNQIAPGTKEGAEAARGTMQGAIEDVAPQVIPLNQQTGSIINLKGAVNTGAAKELDSKGPALWKIMASLGLGAGAGVKEGRDGVEYDSSRALKSALGLMGLMYLGGSTPVATRGAKAIHGLADLFRTSNASLIAPTATTISRVSRE